VVIVLFTIITGFFTWLNPPYSLIPIGLILGVAFVATILRYPMVGVYLYMIIFFFEPNQLFGISFPFERIIALALITILLIHIAFFQKSFQLFPMDKAYTAFVFVCFLSVMFAGDIGLAWDSFFEFLKIFLVYLFVSRIANTPKRMNSIIWLYLLSLGFIAGNSIYNYYSGNFIVRMGIQRAVGIGGTEGTYSDPNSLANTIVLGLPFLFFVARYYRSKLTKLLLYGILLMTLWTVVLTGSRGGMLGVIFVSLFIAFSSKHKVLTAIIALFIIVSVAAVMPEQYKERFETLMHVEDKDKSGAAESAQGRINGLIWGLKFLMEKPLTGVGIGNFRWAYRMQGGIWLDAHNLIGKLAGELGLPGIITFVYFLIVFFKSLKLVRLRYLEREWDQDIYWFLFKALKVSMIALLFQGLTGHNLYRYNWYIYACFIVMIIQITNARIEKELKEASREQPTVPELESPA
jgi:probable O-glycosylation ligase (exosortase A-associated)